MTDITYTTIRAVYHGSRRSVQLDVLESICSALEIQPGDIFQYYQNESDIKSIVISAPDPQVSAKVNPSNDSNKASYRSAADTHDSDWRSW